MKLQNLYRLLVISILVLLQVWIFSPLSIARVATPFVYLFGLWIFPVSSSPTMLTCIGAFMGIALDVLSGTPGLHLASASLAGFIRPYLLTSLVDTDANLEFPPSSKIHGRGIWLSIFTWVAIHHFVLFALDFLSGSSWLYILLRAVSSILVTTILLFVLQLFFLEKKRS